MSYNISYTDETDRFGHSSKDWVLLIGGALQGYVAPKVRLTDESANAMAIVMAITVARPDERGRLPWKISLDTCEKFFTAASWWYAGWCNVIITEEVARILADEMAEFVVKNAQLQYHWEPSEPTEKSR